jgi:hypothetical protein
MVPSAATAMVGVYASVSPMMTGAVQTEAVGRRGVLDPAAVLVDGVEPVAVRADDDLGARRGAHVLARPGRCHDAGGTLLGLLDVLELELELVDAARAKHTTKDDP